MSTPIQPWPGFPGFQSSAPGVQDPALFDIGKPPSGASPLVAMPPSITLNPLKPVDVVALFWDNFDTSITDWTHRITTPGPGGQSIAWNAGGWLDVIITDWSGASGMSLLWTGMRPIGDVKVGEVYQVMFRLKALTTTLLLDSIGMKKTSNYGNIASVTFNPRLAIPPAVWTPFNLQMTVTSAPETAILPLCVNVTGSAPDTWSIDDVRVLRIPYQGWRYSPTAPTPRNWP